MKKIEATIFEPEEIYYQEYWVPSHPISEMVKARSEGKLVLIHRCDCGCFASKELQEKAKSLLKETFGDDPFVAFIGRRTDKKNCAVVLPNEFEGGALLFWK